jgi:GTP-binding protein Era
MENIKIFKSGFIALMGRPNSGKSTLMNCVIGEQLSVVTPLPQTTRQNLKGIYTTDSMQLVFVDTPGIHKGKYVFNDSMINEVRNVIREKGLDVICYMVDVSREFGEEEDIVASIIGSAGVQTIIVFNKIDINKKYEDVKNAFFEKYPQFKDLPNICISANSEKAKKQFLNVVEPFIPPGPQYFDQDDMTDANMRFFASEYIRKQIILNTKEEVPHAVFVEIESYKEHGDTHIIQAVIHVETTGQRGIIVGKGGTGITRIRKAAAKELEKLVQAKVQLTCHIKVTPKWRDDERFLRFMGMPVQ